MSEWISVKDRLPNDDTFVLAAQAGVYCEQALYQDGDFYVHWGRYEETPAPWITHWMPLPDPPAES